LPAVTDCPSAAAASGVVTTVHESKLAAALAELPALVVVAGVVDAAWVEATVVAAIRRPTTRRCW